MRKFFITNIKNGGKKRLAVKFTIAPLKDVFPFYNSMENFSLQ